MRSQRVRFLGFGFALVAVAASVTVGENGVAAQTEDGGVTTRQIPGGGTATFRSAELGPDVLANPEIREQESDEGADPFAGRIVDRTHSRQARPGDAGGSSGRNDDDVRLKASFDGLNHRQQRLANGGNQFSIEPPDQGLCVGNGTVMEAVNDVARAYDSSGNPLSGVVDLNTFFGYKPAVQRTTPPVYGPFVTDPSCFFDVSTQRWFLDVLTLDVDPSTGDFLGPNHIDLAVSKTSDPTGDWMIYRIPVQDDGTDGTPNHGCSEGPCIGDYPHIGADHNGIYITTNEYSLFGPEFHGAQVYAMSKLALVYLRDPIDIVQYDTHGLDNGNSGFTLAPSTSPGGAASTEAGGTEYFLSSNAADEAHGDGTTAGPGSSQQVLVWALTNTSSLYYGGRPVLSQTAVGVNRYATAPKADQKPGSQPLRECLNDPTCATVLLGDADPYAPEATAPLDSNDTRMLQVTYADGRLWGAVDTR